MNEALYIVHMGGQHKFPIHGGLLSLQEILHCQWNYPIQALYPYADGKPTGEIITDDKLVELLKEKAKKP